MVMESPFPPFDPGHPDAEDGPSRRRVPFRHIVPNLITILAICAGMTGVRLAFEGRFELAVAMVLGAAFLDGIDGRVARLLKGQSRFGAEMDSLADIVNFGVAPGLVLYAYMLNDAGSFGWIAALLYASACALRLARFNTMLDDPKRPKWQSAFFVGVPAPAGAGLAMLPLYLSFVGLDLGLPKVTAVLVVGLSGADRAADGEPPSDLVGQGRRHPRQARLRHPDHPRRRPLRRGAAQLLLGDADRDGLRLYALDLLLGPRLRAADAPRGEDAHRFASGVAIRLPARRGLRRARDSPGSGRPARRRACPSRSTSAKARGTIFAATSRAVGSVFGSSPGIAWARIAVRVAPGLTELTRSGVFIVSLAQDRTSASQAALVAA